MKNYSIKNYRNKHILLVVGAIFSVLVNVVPDFKWSEEILMVVWAVIVACLAGKSEKGDELVRENLSKATWISFIMVIIALVVMDFINENWGLHNGTLVYLATGAIVIRSGLFLILDKPEKLEEE